MAHIRVGSVAVRIPPANLSAKKNILKYRDELHFRGQCSLRKLASSSGFDIQWATKTAERSNAKNGGSSDALREKNKNENSKK